MGHRKHFHFVELVHSVDTLLLLQAGGFCAEAATEGDFSHGRLFKWDRAIGEISGQSHFRGTGQAQIVPIEFVHLIAFPFRAEATALDDSGGKDVRNGDQFEFGCGQSVDCVFDQSLFLEGVTAIIDIVLRYGNLHSPVRPGRPLGSNFCVL